MHVRFTIITGQVIKLDAAVEFIEALRRVRWPAVPGGRMIGSQRRALRQTRRVPRSAVAGNAGCR